MVTQTAEHWTHMKCRPCEGRVEKFSPERAHAEIESLDGWRVDHDAVRIEKHWDVKNFMAAIDFFNEIALLAEQEGHHPDLHLEGYRHVWIELSTHAIGGLSENDFIMAAKIDQLPIQLKS